ncbi:MAG: uncharacterized protein A8A55_2886 [Amphiamblys sp. WSBS2006]|nr:MAG: uncharacterized protein A8A55_2886 [Amphiamblys sp. WSBS2006]
MVTQELHDRSFHTGICSFLLLARLGQSFLFLLVTFVLDAGDWAHAKAAAALGGERDMVPADADVLSRDVLLQAKQPLRYRKGSTVRVCDISLPCPLLPVLLSMVTLDIGEQSPCLQPGLQTL